MKELLYVALGGAIGAMLRYSIGLIPIKSEFPFLTMGINILGAICIGGIASLASVSFLSPTVTLFLKTGFCGGFTTFSTFSLESMQLIEKKEWGSAAFYMTGSLLLCLLGVFLGSVFAHFLSENFHFGLYRK